MHLNGENKMSLNGGKLAGSMQMDKIHVYDKKFDLRVVSVHAPRLYKCL